MRVGLHCGIHRARAALYERDVLHEVIPVTPTEVRDPLLSAQRLLENLSSHTATSITFELSELLAPRDVTTAHIIRISPRATTSEYDPFSLPWLDILARDMRPAILHLPGGHNARGQEIVPLGLDAIESLGPAPDTATRFVVTAVGALLNPAHELTVGSALAEKYPWANIEYSHRFHHTSFAVRERTAYVNLVLRERAEEIVTALSFSASLHTPGAKLFIATNCGGSIPLTRLAVTPVDAIKSLRATEAVGAATFGQKGAVPANGTFMYETVRGQRSCEFSGGAPAVVPALVSSRFGKLASPAANVRPGETRDQPDKSLEEYTSKSGSKTASPHKPFPSCGSGKASATHLGALGAASLPRADWVMKLVHVGNEIDMVRAKQAAESQLHARLVSTGVPPEHVRTVESLVTATSYGVPEVVALRIRAIATEERPLPCGARG